MASVYYRGMFEVAKFTLPEKVMNKKDLKESSFSEIKQIMGATDFGLLRNKN